MVLDGTWTKHDDDGATHNDSQPSFTDTCSGKTPYHTRQTDRQTGRQTDRQADRQTGRQTGRQTDRQTDRHTDEGRGGGCLQETEVEGYQGDIFIKFATGSSRQERVAQ